MTAELPIFPGEYDAHNCAFADLDANYWRDGYFAPPDFRYWAMYEFVHASPSFQAVACHLRGLESTLPLPSDLDEVAEVFKDFFIELGPNTPQTNQGIARMEQAYGPRVGSREKIALPTDWWNVKGKSIFGIAAPDPAVRIFKLTKRESRIRVERAKNDCIVAQISLNQSLDDALLLLKKKLGKHEFSIANIQVNPPKFSFLRSDVRRSTMAMCLEVLKWYRPGTSHIPVWWIGNYCAVTKSLSFTQEEFEAFTKDERTYRKKRLEIATSRVLRTALLLAENAARGRFPCLDPFPEAQLTAFKRKAGRPAAQAKRKPREAAFDPALNAFQNADFVGLSAIFGSRLPQLDMPKSKKTKK